MIKLLALHWEFIRRPTHCLENYIKLWPLKYAIVLYVFFSIHGFFQDPTAFGVLQDMLTHLFGNNDPVIVYAYILGACLFNLLSIYYLLPPIARWAGSIEKADFDSDLYRRLVFYSPTAAVIYSAAVLMPLQVMLSIAVVDTTLGVAGWLLFAIKGLLGLWAFVPIVSMLAIHWKGLKKYFGLTTLQVIFVQFVVPGVLALPFFAAGLHRYKVFLQSYIS